MKWETVTSTIEESVFALWNNGKKLVTLAFHPASSAARIEYEDKRRVFLIRQEGLLKNKTVLCNEYGIRMGHARAENKRHLIELGQQRFFYDGDNKMEDGVTIYNELKEEPFAVCALSLPDHINPTHKPIWDKAKYGLLMTLCWYLLQQRLAK
ncbi:MAG: hypothetical protein DI535_18335 [Citrobacter freundii]|nr:MAG: hypothetical protein DI535_18335 [Citrobacter freundii]